MNKNTGMIATIATALLCGLPGLCMCFFGGISMFASMVPGAEIDVMGSNDPSAAMGMGVAFLCVSIILIIIPIAVGFFTLRKKPEGVVGNEPLPPVS